MLVIDFAADRNIGPDGMLAGHLQKPVAHGLTLSEATFPENRHDAPARREHFQRFFDMA